MSLSVNGEESTTVPSSDQGYSDFFTDDDVDADADGSPDPFGFSDLDPNPFDAPIHSNVGHRIHGPLLPPPTQMGFARRQWRQVNAIRLEEKDNREKELRSKIIEEGEVYKRAFHEKRLHNVETNKITNREGEKLYVAKQETFHKEADKQYWKAIAELIPREVPNIEKRGKKDKDNKKPSITFIQGPKPGKPTDLSRLQQILVKLKHTPPAHMVPLAPATMDATKNDKKVSVKDEAANGTVDVSAASADQPAMVAAA